MSWVAVDWGTSRLRAWVHDGDDVTALSSDAGMGTLEPDAFEKALILLIEPYLSADKVTPVICCGMVGARQGWAEAAYAPVPAAPPDANGALRVASDDPRIEVYILPGMSQAKPADVMRGEETQIAGLIAIRPDFDGVLCLPGTHTKWAHISAGEIVSFATFMTGEMFALLSGQSVLRHSLGGDGWDDDAFTTAVTDAMARPERIGSSLFSLRAASLLEDLPPATARARLSGTLIGVELAAARPYWLGREVVLIGDQTVTSPYAAALSAQGVTAACAPADELTLHGLRRAHATLKES
ncbi:2-dehydro-3-deoxygalactonokinase [Sulfitobacter sp. HNIBRBA2951]|uniref:2-dehydro-3-deoxygalactonokinase n=1 Tax=Sulfitobacter aquimarinus TaxID=3158557 RepID=UPI0032DEBAD4